VRAVAYESDVSERVKVTVILVKYDLAVQLDTAGLFYVKNRMIDKTTKKKITKTICDWVNCTVCRKRIT
jgi:hypothetical protein